MSKIPPSRPKIPPERVRAILAKAGVTDSVVLVGVRGFFPDLGAPGRNDRGIYDDCIALVTPGGVVTYNANTDPSIFRKGIATLKTGIHLYRKGNHGISRPGGGYPALRPATEGERLPVIRDPGVSGYGVAINIHRGGVNTTSSEGCQTIRPDQWNDFISSVYRAMDAHGQRVIKYVLVGADGSF
jgi:lysozyme